MKERIKNIQQTGNFTFLIEWEDGKCFEYRLSDLQNICPCIQCEKKRSEGKTLAIFEDVKAFKIHSVGRYAMKILFTKGCQEGIYPFSLLRKMGENLLGEIVK